VRGWRRRDRGKGRRKAAALSFLWKDSFGFGYIETRQEAFFYFFFLSCVAVKRRDRHRPSLRDTRGGPFSCLFGIGHRGGLGLLLLGDDGWDACVLALEGVVGLAHASTLEGLEGGRVDLVLLLLEDDEGGIGLGFLLVAGFVLGILPLVMIAIGHDEGGKAAFVVVGGGAPKGVNGGCQLLGIGTGEEKRRRGHWG